MPHHIKASPFIPGAGHLHGFVYEVETGKLREVVGSPPTQTPVRQAWTGRGVSATSMLPRVAFE